MTDRVAEASPRAYARVGGLLYLFIIVAAGFGELFVRNRLIVWGDAARTAQNIKGSELLFRAGLAGELLTCVCDVALALILYVLLRPVSRNLALLAAFFRLAFVGIYGVAKLFEIAALVAFQDAGRLTGLGPTQLHDLAYEALRVHSLGYGASLLFFGFCCVLFGHLIRNSGYMPRVIGILLEVAGAGYVVFSVAQLLSPSVAGRFLFPWVVPIAFVAELSLGLWLLLKGVDIPKWNEMSRER
ncbi:MAG: DUF4386 domain-containing protein [Candidatus Latescibacterota bacterium]|nr:MAG: DUF4386 domain-containing protein [Candidatus Latescibacterota bacterium]